MQIYRDRIVDQHANVLSYRKIGNSRLLKLAAFLRLLPPEKFNLSYWVSDEAGSLYGGEEVNLRSCGTKACAMGWATAMPLFRRLGLVFHSGNLADPAIVAIEREDLKYSCYQPMAVAQHLFAISHVEADLLFAPGVQDFEATSLEVAGFIERFVRARGEVLSNYGEEFVESDAFQDTVIHGQ